KSRVLESKPPILESKDEFSYESIKIVGFLSFFHALCLIGVRIIIYKWKERDFMKFFHTADWHLGKLVQGVYMTEDQRFILEQFIAAVEEQRPDCVIIAGDLYDRAVPPTEAVNLLDETLAKIVLELDTPVFAVAGNHDSPGRLNFGSRVFRKNGIHIAGHVAKDHTPAVIKDEFGEVHIHLLPYADPSQVRYALENPEIRSHNDAAEALTLNIAQSLDPT